MTTLLVLLLVASGALTCSCYNQKPMDAPMGPMTKLQMQQRKAASVYTMPGPSPPPVQAVILYCAQRVDCRKGRIVSLDEALRDPQFHNGSETVRVSTVVSEKSPPCPGDPGELKIVKNRAGICYYPFSMKDGCLISEPPFFRCRLAFLKPAASKEKNMTGPLPPRGKVIIRYCLHKVDCSKGRIVSLEEALRDPQFVNGSDTMDVKTVGSEKSPCPDEFKIVKKSYNNCFYPFPMKGACLISKTSFIRCNIAYLQPVVAKINP